MKSEKQAWAASGYHVVDMSPEESDEEDGGAGRESVEVDEELESLAVAASSRFPNEWFGSANTPLPNWWERGNLGLPLPFGVFVCLRLEMYQTL